ncbi:ribonuclease H-like domain-containing protein [Tanacetum coccineum]
MLQKCHGHGLTKGDIIQIFYHGLDEPTQGILDITARGIFIYKSPNQAFQFLEDKVLFEHDWPIKSKNDHHQKFVSFTDVSDSNTDHSQLMKKLEALTIKMDSQFQSLKEEMHEMHNKYQDLRDNHDPKNHLNDDTPMCERHEANYIQSEELNNDVRNDLEDFKRCIYSMRTVNWKLFARDDALRCVRMSLVVYFWNIGIGNKVYEVGAGNLVASELVLDHHLLDRILAFSVEIPKYPKSKKNMLYEEEVLCQPLLSRFMICVVEEYGRLHEELKVKRRNNSNSELPDTCSLIKGKFDGKADEGFFVGYSLNSNAFRVINSRTRILEENLHIRFSESTPNVVGSRPDWLFDIDVLTRIKNYQPIIADPNLQVMIENSTNKVNDTGTNEVNVDGGKTSIELLDDPNMTALEDYSIFNFSNNDKDDGAETDMNNLDTTIQVTSIPTTRIHKDHPLNQVIGDLQSAIKSRNMSKNFGEICEEPKKIYVDGYHLWFNKNGMFSIAVEKFDAMRSFIICLRKNLHSYLGLHVKQKKDAYYYTDSDYARASFDRKSTTGGCQFLRCRLISWQCKKQTMVANSITEAEYVAASSCCGQYLLTVGKAKKSVRLMMEKLFGIELELILIQVNAVEDEAVHKELGDSLVRAAPLCFSLEGTEHDQTRSCAKAVNLTVDEVTWLMPIVALKTKIEADHALAKDCKQEETKKVLSKMFDRAFKRVNTFVDFRTYLVEDEVAIDVVPLATKSPSIIDWKIHKEGKKSYYQIVKADGKSQMYKVFSQMLKSFTKEDLEDQYKLVKAKYDQQDQWKT